MVPFKSISKDRARDFFVLLLVLTSGVAGVFVSLDLFVFFLAYEIAVLPMYLLIAIWGTSNKVAPGGPFKFTWKMLDIGGKEYVGIKRLHANDVVDDPAANPGGMFSEFSAATTAARRWRISGATPPNSGLIPRRSR